ncbi:exodeoxyribonuclease V subunit gamma [Pseudoxanthomonas composti]|uniref:RecBCD enzyme subunit RecC n=1 Tax=Pseudoxanthomonas composti TaxID=2137479 RepID=A0A4Q1JXE9_9GAMM|nr:exodeoxyribonuclease V subunit gamma [Pseudoxanthomonas composti]RXR05982.1 exodeoxyribonuclease V subunit gamma [Pseudoxanthomonas composti]
MPPAPDFRLYPSNALELLAGLLAHELRQPVPGQSILTPEVVLIPQVAMRRWLQATLAAEHGVAANLEFLTPGEFVARALEANLGPAQDELDAASLRWHLYAALTDPAVLSDPALAAVRTYLQDEDALKPWALAGELAGVFEKYQAWRRDWLLRWEAGAAPNDPQAVLWRHLATGRAYRARRIQAYLDRFSGQADALPQGLPRRVFAFATLNVSPDVLRVLATQARVGTLHFYLPTPAQGYWGDLQTLGPRRRARADDLVDESLFDAGDNRLLQAWGAAGRDFMAMLGSYEVAHPSAEIDVYADPLGSGQRPLRQGGLGDSLLKRLQSDLFHRRRPPVPAPLAALDRTDPSLQVHACHTRLRELQVLHDQLRALLEDPRFDPPLQPRQIAVLAPDIDPYIPYLEAVFGADKPGAKPGSAGKPGSECSFPSIATGVPTSLGKLHSDPGFPSRIPYALADTSPLAGEPLAEVFVRLLNLPVSRFGLNEILDLLASPPLAEAAGLDAAAFERLHGWLQAAGARWGLDAAHRAQHGAPHDDAYTWAFALDRLLLGHASGSSEDIAGVAPFDALEGGALEALDALIRLLHVLAGSQRRLDQALTPAQWRERLLALLDALLPETPAAAATQRALDRLRKLVDDFAREAERAGFQAAVPAEVVRTHFASVLAEADTRAPLLTGGLSVGRMVPMRLLPFRVICLLGMNDGDFPRRDPAAGLNQLTAELGTHKRRYGDRSTREDDRFLFLQLFASAQDVFYVSYLGADARDGSVREPSVLVTELIGEAAAHHADAAAAAKALTVHHALQPFAPAAFGAEGDPRRFSYRTQWQPASVRIGGTRAPLAPWVTAPLPARTVEEDALSLDALRRFFSAPAEQFLRQRLDLRLADASDLGEDVEPLLAPGRGLQKALLQQQVFEALLQGREQDLYDKLRARALLPSGPLGHRQLAALVAQLRPYALAFDQWRGQAERGTQRVEIDLDGLRLHGRLEGLYDQGLAHVRLGAMNGPAAIRQGLDWLVASAAGLDLPLVRFHEAQAGVGPFERAPIDPASARAALRRLLSLRAEGLQAPLPFGPYSGWEFFSAEDPHKAVKAAAARWRGSDHTWGEGNGEAYQLALRGCDPFADAALLRRFAETSLAIFHAVEHGVIHPGLGDAHAFFVEADTEAEA